MKAIYPFVSDTVNQFNYSQDFANAGWSKSNVTVTANTTIAPDGTTTASTAQNTQASSYIFQSNLALSATTYNQSVYAKKNNNDWFAIYTSDQGSNYSIAWFNLNTGVKGTASAVGNFSATSSTMTSVGNGWYRCSLTFTKPSTVATDSASIVPSGDNTFTRVIGQNVYMWGAQFQTGALTDYQLISTTTSNRFVSQFKYNLKDARDLDAAFRLAFNGTWTYSKQGATPNGVNGFANTYLNATTVFTDKALGFGVYVNTLSSFTNDKHAIGAFSGSQFYGSVQINSVTGVAFNMYAASTVQMNPPTATGHMFLTNNGTTVNAYVRTQTASGSLNGTNRPNQPFSIGGINVNGTTQQFVNNRFCAGYICDSLNATEAGNLYTTIQTYQTELARQV
jgi:hypothetical protein